MSEGERGGASGGGGRLRAPPCFAHAGAPRPDAHWTHQGWIHGHPQTGHARQETPGARAACPWLSRPEKKPAAAAAGRREKGGSHPPPALDVSVHPPPAQACSLATFATNGRENGCGGAQSRPERAGPVGRPPRAADRGPARRQNQPPPNAAAGQGRRWKSAILASVDRVDGGLRTGAVRCPGNRGPRSRPGGGKAAPAAAPGGGSGGGSKRPPAPAHARLTRPRSRPHSSPTGIRDAWAVRCGGVQ